MFKSSGCCMLDACSSDAAATASVAIKAMILVCFRETSMHANPNGLVQRQYKYKRKCVRSPHIACKVCTVALEPCFIGLVMAMTHGRRQLAPTDIGRLCAIGHNHAAW